MFNKNYNALRDEFKAARLAAINENCYYDYSDNAYSCMICFGYKTRLEGHLDPQNNCGKALNYWQKSMMYVFKYYKYYEEEQEYFIKEEYFYY